MEAPAKKIINIRLVKAQDRQLLFSWRNSQAIVAQGKSGRVVAWDEHCDWFEKILCHPNDFHLFIIELNETAVGQVRFDRINNSECEISIYLLPEYTGSGCGVEAIKKSCTRVFALMEVVQIRSIIKTDNKYSISAFQKAGFVQDGSNNNGLMTLILRQIPHNRLSVGSDEVMAVAETVSNGQWACGPKVEFLEKTLAEIAEVKYAICVSSGLSALRLVLLGIGVGSTDKVLVPAYSCVALANATLACGAMPIPVEVNADGWNINPKELVHAMEQNEDSKVVVAVNTFGLPADLSNSLYSGLTVIEDCAHGFGLRINQRCLGGRSHAAILSFYATKLIGAGEGGAVLTNNDELADFVRTWRDYGDQPANANRLNEKMTDIEATLALCQLRKLPDFIKSRQALAERYHEKLSSIFYSSNAIGMPDIKQDRVWYRYPIEIHKAKADYWVHALKQHGVCAALPITDWRDGGSFCPIASKAYRSVLSLPIYPTLSLSEQDRVIDAIEQVYQNYMKNHYVNE